MLMSWVFQGHFQVKVALTKKTTGTVENPARPQIILCDTMHDYYITTQHIHNEQLSYHSKSLNYLKFDISRSLKVICDGAILDTPYHIWFIIIFNTNLWPDSALFGNIKLRNLSDLIHFTLQSHSR